MDLNLLFKKASQDFSMKSEEKTETVTTSTESVKPFTDSVDEAKIPSSEPSLEKKKELDAVELKTDETQSASLLGDVPFNNAMELYFEAVHNANMISSRICDGEVVDEAQACVIYKTLSDTYSKYVSVRNYIEPNGKPVPLIRYGIPASDMNLVMEGNKLVGEAMRCNDLEKYEQGKWLLYCCQQ